MRRLDLNMTMEEWLTQPVPSVRICNIIREHKEKGLLLRDFLKLPKTYLLQYRYGKKTLQGFLGVLAHYGLSMDMTDEELAEYEDKPTPQPAPKADTIDWEQRRWELVVSLFVHWNNISDFNGLTSLDIADNLIKEYKQSLNKEEQL